MHAEADAERFKETMDAASKERSDMFDSMFQSEQKIRLGEPGWKARYYEVRSLAGLPLQACSPVDESYACVALQCLCC